MKIVILITVIESFAVMLAIMYFYYRRSRSGKRAFSFSWPTRDYYKAGAGVGGAALFSTSKLKRNGTTLSIRRAISEAKTLKSKK